MPLSIEQPPATTYFLALCAISEVFHFGEISAGSHLTTGQPIAVYGTDSATLLDLLFTSYVLNEDSGSPIDVDMDNSVLEEVFWSIYNVEEDAQAVVDDINSFDFVKVALRSHNGQWAVPVQQSVFDAMSAGDAKDRLLAAAALSISEGRRKTKDDMLADGWV